jgi:hypothetical protein
MAVKKKTVSKNSMPKKKLGRPSKYDERFCEYLIEHLSRGLSYETFGACLPDYEEGLGPVAMRTVYEWEKHDTFLQAKKDGWELCRAFWEKQGNKGLWGGKSFVSPVWIFNMKNRFGWTDKKEIDLGDKTIDAVKLAYALQDDDDPENE